jgi:hypothetical protein
MPVFFLKSIESPQHMTRMSTAASFVASVADADAFAFAFASARTRLSHALRLPTGCPATRPVAAVQPARHA